MNDTENQIEEENITIDLEEQEGQSSVVQVEDETRTNVRETSDDSKQELENYSENVQKRINELTAKRKTAIEEAEAAYQYAKQKEAENEQLRKKYEELNTGYVGEYGTRIESQSSEAKRLAKEAFDLGDMDKFSEAQELIARLAIEKERLRIQKARVEEQDVSVEAQQPAQTSAPQRQAPLDSKLVDWMDKNPWFNKDRVMTIAAQEIHRQLVADEGFDPTSDDYYKEIDRRMRVEMPNKFQEKRTVAQSVAPASSGRSNKSGRKKAIELTPGEVAFANKMKIPLERYAKEKAKIQQRSA
tara:strand:+ start:777 stop:1676 length:900 start_codon:yes stop_codon:yes gene_type:complete